MPALNIYLNEFNFTNSPQKLLSIFSINRKMFTFEELLDTLKNLHIEINDNDLLKEYSKLEKSWESICLIETLSVDKKWCKFFKENYDCHQFEKICSFVFFFQFLQVMHVSSECLFIMGNIWREKRNRLLPKTVKAELQIKINYNLNC